MDKLDVKAFSIAVGSMWGFLVLIAGLSASVGYGTPFVQVMSSIYVGYTATLAGSILGAIYGFIDGAIGGFIISYVYNYVSKKFK